MSPLPPSHASRGERLRANGSACRHWALLTGVRCPFKAHACVCLCLVSGVAWVLHLCTLRPCLSVSTPQGEGWEEETLSAFSLYALPGPMACQPALLLGPRPLPVRLGALTHSLTHPPTHAPASRSFYSFSVPFSLSSFLITPLTSLTSIFPKTSKNILFRIVLDSPSLALDNDTTLHALFALYNTIDREDT